MMKIALKLLKTKIDKQDHLIDIYELDAFFKLEYKNYLFENKFLIK